MKNPLSPIKTSLTFPQLQGISKFIQRPLLCGMCGHKFPPDAKESDHECNPPLFEIGEITLKPYPQIPMTDLFFLRDEQYP